jgi:hypothetical protein
MGMTASIYSINALSTELALDRRTVTVALKDVVPDGTDARGYPGWRLRTALERLGYQRNDKRSSGTSYKERWLRARAERAELELKERRGELVEVPPLLHEIEQRWTNILLQVRQRLLAVPTKVAGQHSRLNSPQATFQVSTKLVREALDMLASSSEAATEMPGIGSRRGDRSSRLGRSDMMEEDPDAEAHLAGNGPHGAPGVVDVEPKSEQVAAAASGRRSHRGRPDRAGGPAPGPGSR